MWLVTEQLCLSGVGTEVQPVQSERAAAESQQKPAGSRSDAALQLPAEPALPAGGSEVRLLTRFTVKRRNVAPSVSPEEAACLVTPGRHAARCSL